MESSLREHVRAQITDYADNVKKYFEALAQVAENATLDEANKPEQIIKRMAVADDNLQNQLNLSKAINFVNNR
ncbi:unnamed protein product [Mucor hiemalis]